MGISAITALVGTYYIQIFLATNFFNRLFCWILAGIFCSLITYSVVELIMRRLNKKSPKKAWEQSDSVFRIHMNDSSVDDWILPENNLIKKNSDRTLMGYIPLDSKTGNPHYIPSFSVERLEYLFTRKQPKGVALMTNINYNKIKPYANIADEDTLKSTNLDPFYRVNTGGVVDSVFIFGSSQSNLFNPLKELIMHTSRRFRQANRLISFKHEVLLDSRTLYTELIVSSSDIILMETYYFKVIGTNLLDFQLYEKEHEITLANELVIPLNENETLKIPLNEKSMEEFLDEQTKERTILEHTVETLNAMISVL